MLAAKADRKSETIASRMAAIGRPTSGFDYLRLILAVTIVIWHAMLVTRGLPWASAVMFSPAGVVMRTVLPMFFALSGFLVAGSLERNPSVRTFVLFRALRILPALAVEISLSALAIGALTTSLAITDYYASPQFHAYFLNIVGLIHYNLPGVFDGNPDDVVNRSLWTIPSELECYVFLVGAALVGLYAKKQRLFVLALVVYALYIAFRLFRDGAVPGFQPFGGTVLSRLLIFYFMTGVLFYRWRAAIPMTLPLFVISAAASVALLMFDGTVWLSLPFVVYATVYLGLSDPRKIALLTKGDYSYGVYLYAYPIQQTGVLLFPRLPWYGNVALTLPVIFLFAALSWHWIEKPALSLKRLVGRRPTLERVKI